jgi:hypothetical protein
MNNHGPMGRCYYAYGGGSSNKQSNGNGWSTAAAGTTSSGCDPIILADEFTDGYEVMHWPYLHGKEHPAEVVPAATSKVQALRFFVMRRGAVVHGLRFYTADDIDWTASCKLWLGTGAGGVVLASGTIDCTGVGMYDCMYTVPAPGPVPINDAIFYTQRGNGSRFLVASIYNTTNTNYTRTGTEFVLCGGNYPPFIGNMVSSNYGGKPIPSVTAPIPPGGDVWPNLQPSGEVYPISPLVTV